MVEALDNAVVYPQLDEPLEIQHFYDWNEYTEEEPECDEEKA